MVLSAFDSLATGETALKERERERALVGESAEPFFCLPFAGEGFIFYQTKRKKKSHMPSAEYNISLKIPSTGKWNSNDTEGTPRFFLKTFILMFSNLIFVKNNPMIQYY